MFILRSMDMTFYGRVQENGEWTLMCPDECPGLSDCYGDKFKELYTKYESEGRGKRTIKAQELWFQILQSQIETGTPYLLYKDACNIKSNQKNLGTIKSSNLCCEIVEYSSKDESAVCNLASICLPRFIKDVECESNDDVNENVGKDDKNNIKMTKEFDFDKLGEITKMITRNLNKVIDINFYPIPETRNSNKRHRPIGIGVQGLADVFAILKMPFDGEEAKSLIEKYLIIYYNSLRVVWTYRRKEKK